MIFLNSWKSEGAASSEYRGCSKTSQPTPGIFGRACNVVCCLILSRWKTMALRLARVGGSLYLVLRVCQCTHRNRYSCPWEEAVKYNTFPILANWKQNLLRVKTCFDAYVWWFTALPTAWLFAPHISLDDSFFSPVIILLKKKQKKNGSCSSNCRLKSARRCRTQTYCLQT